ncbi:claudin-34-like [Pygocentrus nattereri]|uniref:claudin-34-like n=1 Tax=Pygocentrus nattereri TaxID=42514 RepID=UPI0008143D06|nr:claudin-34-like [Pygocentrus nattereri]XP_037401491.1 claudin-34-like [Pygocentrus nattereri]
MPYLVHTAHAQFVGFLVGAIGWILTMVAIGLVQWRIWVVSDLTFINSGQAWVGIWRTCFYTHVLVTSEYEVMYCQKIRLSDTFTPSEIAAAQPMMLLALILGLFGNSSVIYGLRNIYFGLDKQKPIILAFSIGGGLLILAGVSSFIPLFWNLNSVATNQTINFPDNFYMPPAPVEQYVGPGIAIGIFASILVVVSGVVFLSYKFPEGLRTKVEPSCLEEGHSGLGETGMTLSLRSTPTGSQDIKSCYGMDNPAFQS